MSTAVFVWGQNLPPRPLKPTTQSTYVPACAFSEQPARSSEAISVDWGPYHRSETGWSEVPDRCMMMELGEEVVSPFSYLKADNDSTPFAR